MSMQEIEVAIDPDGNVSISVKGLKGDGCLALTRDFEAALGGEITSRERTAEAYETAQSDVHLNTSS